MRPYFATNNHLLHRREQALGRLTHARNELHKSKGRTSMNASNIAKKHFFTKKRELYASYYGYWPLKSGACPLK